ncbi:MAG: hypothetical protein ABMB14_39040, partial [Myxococcota bacterium]
MSEAVGLARRLLHDNRRGPAGQGRRLLPDLGGRWGNGYTTEPRRLFATGVVGFANPAELVRVVFRLELPNELRVRSADGRVVGPALNTEEGERVAGPLAMVFGQLVRGHRFTGNEGGAGLFESYAGFG